MQSRREVTYVLCDFGNSSLKLRYDQQTIRIAYTERAAWELHVVDLLASLRSPLLLIATVAPHRTSSLFRSLQQRGVECLVCNVADALPATNPILPYEGVQGIGIDRILGLIGARRLVEPPLATVDCGTAVTVNVVSADGRCRGGAIFAGAQLQLYALSKATAALPLLSFTAPSELNIGTTTEEALQLGTLASVVGGVRELLSIFSRQIGAEPLSVVISGGGGLPVATTLSKSWEGKLLYCPELVLEGMEVLLENASVVELWAHVQSLQALVA
ncbi:MAG: type III pantothenate kinase [Chlorobiota bacterium]